MEERIIDKEREIKVKRRPEGDDIVDALAEDGGEPSEEELVLELPEEEYDEDLVGLTPSQLKEELERREKARREAEEESARLSQAGAEKLGEEAFEEAESLFAQAVMYDGGNLDAGKGLWIARTKDFTSDEAFYLDTNAEEFNVAPDEVRAFVLERVGGKLEAERKAFRGEADALRGTVEESIEFRRGYFRDNKRYYLVRFGIVFAIFALFLIACGISASFIYATRSVAPIVLVGTFGGLAFVMLVFVVLYARKLVVAHRLCRANEDRSSTEKGARLVYLDEKLRCLDLVFRDGEEEAEE